MESIYFKSVNTTKVKQATITFVAKTQNVADKQKKKHTKIYQQNSNKI